MTPLPGGRNLYRNELAVPRAYLTPGARVAGSDLEAMDVVTQWEFDPRLTVVVESALPSPPEGSEAVGSARILVDEPDRVMVGTDSMRAAWLVLNDTFAPGWTARVDKRPATLLRANGLVRAVPVGPGKHEVEFVYAPSSVRWGAATSLGALLAVGALLVASGRAASRPVGG